MGSTMREALLHTKFRRDASGNAVQTRSPLNSGRGSPMHRASIGVDLFARVLWMLMLVPDDSGGKALVLPRIWPAACGAISYRLD